MTTKKKQERTPVRVSLPNYAVKFLKVKSAKEETTISQLLRTAALNYYEIKNK